MVKMSVIKLAVHEAEIELVFNKSRMYTLSPTLNDKCFNYCYPE